MPHCCLRKELFPYSLSLKQKNTFLQELTTDDDKQVQVLFPDYISYLLPPDTLGEKDIVGSCGEAQEGIPV